MAPLLSSEAECEAREEKFIWLKLNDQKIGDTGF
jgi:hypothetical protein